MIILSVCNHKGGTGKTTAASHLAMAFSLLDLKVLLIDLDPQCFLTRALGVDEPPVEESAAMLFQPKIPLSEVPPVRVHGFDLLPSSTSLTRRMRDLNKPTDVLWARETIPEIGNYDLVMIDTAAAFTTYSLNAIVASRYVLIPVMPEYQPVVGAKQTHHTVMMVRQKLNPQLQDPFFLMSLVDGRKRNHEYYRTYMRNEYGAQVLETEIRTSTAVSVRYPDEGSVFQHAPRSRGAVDFMQTAEELAGRMRLQVVGCTHAGSGG